jgi:hypothetical protein
MTFPETARERLLLHLAATMCRGLTQSQGNVGKNNTTTISDDDYLPCDGISYVEDLVELLVNSNNAQGSVCLVNPFDTQSAREKRKSRALESFELLQNYIAPIKASERRTLFSRMEPEFDELQELKCDPVWFLDYLPMLRHVCISEHHDDCLFQATLRTPGEIVKSTNCKATRGSIKRVRKHYLEEIVPEFVWKTFNTTAREIGASFMKFSFP